MTGNSHILPEHDVRPYSIAQLADRWGCSDSMIRKLVNQGELRCFRIGVLIRISAAEVARFERNVEVIELAKVHDELSPPRPPKTIRRIGRKPRSRPPIKITKPGMADQTG